MTAFIPEIMGFDRAWPWLLAIAVFGYLMGSVPFGLLIGRLLGLGDVRRIGSGNIGATNVLRTGHRGAAAATLALDMLKGAVAVWIAYAQFGELPAQVAGIAALLGHAFPIWLRFRGGKGVATYIGVLIATNWIVAALAVSTWALTARLTRISSLSALVMVLFAPLWMFWVGVWSAIWMGVVLGILVVLLHRANIVRLLRGTEPRIGRGR